MDVPGGSVKTRGGEILIRTTERRVDGEGFADIVVLSRPDGTEVLFVHKRIGEKNRYETNLWLAPSSGGDARPFTTGGRDGQGRWSADGSQVAFVRGHENAGPQVYLIEAAGGMLDGHTFKAYLPGGASGGILPASMADIPLDFGTLEEHGCFIGSAAVIILSDYPFLPLRE